MIHYLYGTQLEDHAPLAAGMFRARAARPCPTSGKGTIVDALGWETDDLDAQDPLYVIVTDADDHHAGSLRLLPSVGATRLAQGPGDLSAHRDWSPDIWEVSRLCQSRGAPTWAGARLMLAVSEIGLGLGLRACTGVMTPAHVRAVRRAGWPPVMQDAHGPIAVGRWTFSDAIHDRLCTAARVDARQSRDWWELTFETFPACPFPSPSDRVEEGNE